MHTLVIDACALLLECMAVPGCVEKFVEHNGAKILFDFITHLSIEPSNTRNMLRGDSSILDDSALDVPHEKKEASESKIITPPVARIGFDAPTVIAAMRLFARVCQLPSCVNTMEAPDEIIKLVIALYNADLGSAHEDINLELRSLCADIVGDLCDPQQVEESNDDEEVDVRRRQIVRCRKFFRRCGGVEIFRKSLDVSSDELARQGSHLTMSIIDAVWRSVLGTTRSEDRFIADDGVDSLLNLIEIVPSTMYGQILGCLADLMANPNARPYFRAWRSDKNLYGAATMCIRMWAAEEHRRDIRRGPAGVLLNMDLPLQGKMVPKKIATVSPRSAGSNERDEERDDGDAGERGGEGTLSSGSNFAEPGLDYIFPPASKKRGGVKYERLREALAAAKDMVYFGKEQSSVANLKTIVSSTDLRMKIWALLDSVGWEKLDVESDDLCTETALIVLCLCRRYDRFVQSEAWRAVKNDLQKRRVATIRPDTLLLEKKLEVGFNTAMETRYEQLQLLQELRSRGNREEREFYESIKLQQEQEIQAHLVSRKMVDPRREKRSKMKRMMKD